MSALDIAQTGESGLPSENEQDDEEEEAEQLITTEEEDATDSIRELPPDFDEDEYADEEDEGAEGDEDDDDDDEEEDYDEDNVEGEDFPRKAKDNDRKSNDQGDEDEGEMSGGGESSEEGSDWIRFLKQPPQSMDDFMEDPDDDVSVKQTSSIDIMAIEDLTRGEAEGIAERIIEMLEEDLAAYVEKTGIKFPQPLSRNELKRLKHGLKDNESASSFNSELSDILPGEPSKIRMTYDKGVSVYADLSLMHLAQEDMVDKEVQVNLHRQKKKPPAKKFSRYCQTLEMTFIPSETALLIFKHLYPQMDDFKVKEPPSRKASEDLAITMANDADPNIDNKRKGPQIISLSNKKQLLQPLMDDYYKDEKFWTGSRFVGEYKNRQFYKGNYDHPTGVKMESEFENGHFHTKKHLGKVSYPRGDTFEGEWVKGRYQSGVVTFSDELKFSSNDWKYCEPPDRRFKVERYYGIKPAGMTLFSDQCPAPHVPPGMYDVGDGFYNPKTGDVRGYDGFLLRHATISERNWIERNCRKVHETIEHVAPKFLMERIPGSYVECEKRIPLTKKRYH